MPPTLRDGIDVVEQNHSQNDAAFHAEDEWRELLAGFLDTAWVAAATGGDETPVRLRTEHGELGARLAVDDHGPPVPDDLLPQLFDPGHLLREGNDPLDLAACRSTVLRWRGNAWAVNRPDGMTFA